MNPEDFTGVPASMRSFRSNLLASLGDTLHEVPEINRETETARDMIRQPRETNDVDSRSLFLESQTS